MSSSWRYVAQDMLGLYRICSFLPATLQCNILAYKSVFCQHGEVNRHYLLYVSLVCFMFQKFFGSFACICEFISHLYLVLQLYAIRRQCLRTRFKHIVFLLSLDGAYMYLLWFLEHNCSSFLYHDIQRHVHVLRHNQERRRNSCIVSFHSEICVVTLYFTGIIIKYHDGPEEVLQPSILVPSCCTRGPHNTKWKLWNNCAHKGFWQARLALYHVT